MNWDDLRIFLAVARAPTMAAAAQQLGIDPSTVGRRIARLSARLNATLFEPGAGPQLLTPQGHSLLAYAERAEAAAHSAAAEVAQERSLLAGMVRVSIAEGFATHVVARHLPAFRAAHPGIRVELVATNGFLNPSRREADLAVMLARPARGPLIARKLTEYRLALYAARTLAPLPTQLDQLRDHPLVGYIKDFIYAPELRYLDELGPGLEPALSSSSINVQHQLVRAGAGLSILPCFIADRDPSLVRLLPHDVSITRSFWIVVHKDIRRIARVAAVMDWLATITREERPLLLGETSPPA